MYIRKDVICINCNCKIKLNKIMLILMIWWLWWKVVLLKIRKSLKFLGYICIFFRRMCFFLLFNFMSLKLKIKVVWFYVYVCKWLFKVNGLLIFWKI